MASIKDIKAQLKKIKLSGLEKLRDFHCIELSENASLCEIVDSIGKIPMLKNAATLAELYNGAEFPEGYELVLDVPNVTNLRRFLQYADGVKKLVLKGRPQELGVHLEPLNCDSAFFGNRSLEIIDVTDFYFNPENVDYVINNATALKEIRGIIYPQNIISAQYSFYHCPALEEFRLDKESLAGGLAVPYSPLLSAQTIQSIVDALVTKQAVNYLLLHKDVIARFTDEQKEQVYNKNWTLIEG